MRFKRFTSFLMVLLLLVPLAACQTPDGVKKFNIGKGLPDWSFSEPRQEAALSADDKAGHIRAKYVSDTDHADVWVYDFEKSAGVSLEAFGLQMAEKHLVRLRMMTDKGCPCANFVFCPCDGTDTIHQAYIYEGTDAFVEVCVVYKTNEITLEGDDLRVLIPKGYLGKPTEDGVFPKETVYTPDSPYLPFLTVRRFDKTYFTPETYNTGRMTDEMAARYAEYAEGGWTLQDEVDYYADTHHLLIRDFSKRGDYDTALIAYEEDGNYLSKLFLDCGSEIIMICAESKDETFQFFETAVFDTLLHTIVADK